MKVLWWRLIDQARSTGLLFVLVAMLTACSGSSDEKEAPDVAAKAVADQDIALLKAVYSDQRTPAGFLQVSVPDAGFFTLSHVKNTDILALADRNQQPVYELSSNDFVEAMDWSETAATYQETYRQLVDVSETDFYFQFTRIDPANPSVPHFSRVFKRDFLNRDGVDRAEEDSLLPVYLGAIAIPFINIERVAQVVEYLWRFSASNNYGTAVVSTSIEETARTIVYRMQEGRMQMSYTGQCDVVDVYNVSYTVSKDSGAITRTQSLSHQLSSERKGGIISLCR